MPRWSFACSAALCALACTAPGSTPTGRSWHGELAVYVVNRGDHVQREHRLRLADGTVRALAVADQPAAALAAVAPGTRLRIWGDDGGQAIRVAHFQADETPPAVISSALIAGQPKPKRRWAFVLVDVDGGGNTINKDSARSVLFNPDRPDSIRSYFREVSYGVQDLDGEVFGPIAYQMGGRCDTDRLAASLRPQIPGQFDQYLWFFGTQQPPCNWAGIAELGRADRPTRHSWYNSFHSCTILVQEPGHNFGMVHSSALRCTLNGQPVPLAYPGEPGVVCEHVEYGNPFDPMGNGDCFHMNGVQKAYQDWLAGCNVIKVTESGTYTLHPLESACDGPQLLQIPFPQPRTFGKAGVLTSYYLELRAPVGYRDRKLTPQVLVLAANDVREARLTGNNNWLLDMTPETKKLGDEALPVGRPYQDVLPGGPKFTVLSADATKAVIQVELDGKPAQPGRSGAAVCSDGTAYDMTVARQCIAPPTPAAPAAVAPDGGADAALPGGGGDAAVVADVAVPANQVVADRMNPPPAAGGNGNETSPPGGTSTPRAASSGCQMSSRRPDVASSPAASLLLLGIVFLILLAIKTRRNARFGAPRSL